MIALLLSSQIVTYLIVVHVISYHYYNINDPTIIDSLKYLVMVSGVGSYLLVVSYLYFSGDYYLFVFQYGVLLIGIIYTLKK